MYVTMKKLCVKDARKKAIQLLFLAWQLVAPVLSMTCNVHEG